MKRPPDIEALEEVLRSSKLASGGFLGEDSRPIEEIIEADAAEVKRLGADMAAIIRRMKDITLAAERGQGTVVQIDARLEARAIDVRGQIPCPWPHPGTFNKTVVEVLRTDTDEVIQWSALNIHMIESHGFFEGIGSPFRVDPASLISIMS